jgi:adenylate cyclase
VLAVAVGMLLVDKFVLQDVQAPTEVVAIGEVTADKSLAVLPFVAMSSGPDDGYFADGLTEEILNSLAQLPELLVTARTSAFSFKGQDIPIPEIATTLGVAHVVEGSVRRAGDQLRITAQLIRAHDGFHLWSETYDRSSADSLGVQGEIAEKIASALGVVLDEEQQERMQNSGLRNPEAFIAFQKGIELYVRAHELSDAGQIAKLAQANVLFDEVLALEPEVARVYFNRADYYIHLAALADASTDEAGRAAGDATIAVAKSDLQKAARYAITEGGRLGATLEYTLIARDWRRLPALYRAATQSTECMSPSWWGVIGPFTEPLDDTLALWKRALACNPLSFYDWANLSDTQATAGDFTAAVATATEGMKLIQHVQLSNALINGYIGLGEFDDALTANERLMDDATERNFNRIKITAARGDAERVRTLREEFVQEEGEAALYITLLAVLGERDRANQAATAMDARPLGFLDLLSAADSCRCGAPFDLEFTPNFARLVDEAELVWPPPGSIDWPLKDW